MTNRGCYISNIKVVCQVCSEAILQVSNLQVKVKHVTPGWGLFGQITINLVDYILSDITYITSRLPAGDAVFLKELRYDRRYHMPPVCRLKSVRIGYEFSKWSQMF